MVREQLRDWVPIRAPTWQVADTGGEEWTPEGVPRFVLILGAPAGAKAFTWAACALTAPGFEKYRGSIRAVEY